MSSSGGPGGEAAAPAARDWAEGLGMDALLAIFQRLDHGEILWSAQLVCLSWCRAAWEEPSLWRRITMRGHEGYSSWWLNRCGAGCEAVRRSAGQCEAFYGEYAADDGFLIYLAEQAPCLKSLRLISCHGVTEEGIAEAVMELPLLEELEVSLCDNVGGSEVFEVVGEVCPLLKRFRLSKQRFDVNVQSRHNAFRGIASMHGLQSLQLFSCALNNEDLETILDGCPNLESLDIRHCFNVNMEGTLLLKCARIKTIRLPDDPTDDYDLKFESPIRTLETFVPLARWLSVYSYPSSDSEYDNDDSGDEYDYGSRKDYDNSGDDSDSYSEPSRYEVDLDKYDKMLPPSMRIFLK